MLCSRIEEIFNAFFSFFSLTLLVYSLLLLGPFFVCFGTKFEMEWIEVGKKGYL